MAKGRNGNYRRAMLELVCITGIFAIVSVFLVRFYLTADRLQGKAVAVNSATLKAESLAETIKAVGLQQAVRQFQMAEEDGLYIMRFDKNWDAVSSGEKYQIILQPQMAAQPESAQDGLLAAVIYAGGAGLKEEILEGHLADEELLCRLRVASYGNK